MATIIWIEDDVDIINSVVRPLELANHEIVRLRTAKDVFDHIEEIRKADLILLDMILPPGDMESNFGRYPGLDILFALRKEYDVTTPVIVLTVVTENRKELINQLDDKELGVADIIHKPVRPSVLKERVESVLKSNQ